MPSLYHSGPVVPKVWPQYAWTDSCCGVPRSATAKTRDFATKPKSTTSAALLALPDGRHQPMRMDCMAEKPVIVLKFYRCLHLYSRSEGQSSTLAADCMILETGWSGFRPDCADQARRSKSG